MSTVDLDVQGMSCGSCIAKVTDALKELPGVDAVWKCIWPPVAFEFEATSIKATICCCRRCNGPGIPRVWHAATPCPANQQEAAAEVAAAKILKHKKRYNAHEPYYSISLSDCWCLSCDRVADHIGRAGPYLPRQIYTDGRCCCHGTAADRSRLQ